MSSTITSLEFIFITNTGASQKVTIKDVKENVSESDISDFVNDTIRNKYFVPLNGTSITDIKSVDIVKTVREKVI